MAVGWIRIHRSIQEHWIWKDPVKFCWWMDILLNVNHADAKVNIGFELFDCKRGQSVMSLQNWAERWKTSKDTARNFLKLLEKDSMILHENIGKSTRITVCNYDSYQSELHDSQTQTNRKPNARSPKQECKEEQEQKEVYTFENFWNDYDKKTGKDKAESKWKKLKSEDKMLIKEYLPNYKLATEDKKFRKNPETFLNNQSWKDEIVGSFKNFGTNESDRMCYFINTHSNDGKEIKGKYSRFQMELRNYGPESVTFLRFE